MNYFPLLTPLLFVLLLSDCAHQQVSYKNDLTPIVNNKCVECHTAPNGNGYRTTGMAMTSYDELMKGSIYGPIVIAGDSQRSILNMLVEGRAGNVRKNLHDNNRELSDEEIRLFKEWVEQGAKDN